MDWFFNPKLQAAARALVAGEVIAYPTEAVWGVGCDPHNDQAVYKLLAMKRRDVEKGLILVAASMDQIEPLLRPLTVEQRQQLHQGWPGPLTWLVPDLRNQVPEWVKGQHTSVALRVSAHPVVSALCRAVGGPIVSTSANPQGKAPALHSWQVRRYFGDSLAALAPGAVGLQAKPTEIRDLVTGSIIRAS
ncbi:tRNA threonylcarbamoyladenosine biosynthesis protein RimN [Pseudomaricurvus alkylphenolicus]|jgi:L-threonylcarbamoyladenylate synthase|uniref:L-threonylcarbamoyladenylate synthase n=1 Tax=Pseudomaricurvus alkylphenolicus TaxID=1306991 RepID=UPI0014232488|nr:Sua5/YciO/YrdC/YwlC family protein [Pseudomaricurvus alkylphenolicus]NIB39513.1 tRNA threonylcarbamoyladenosine biosynthesis protein RimN [Pseudomaricurvus alkylphenolicus]